MVVPLTCRYYPTHGQDTRVPECDHTPTLLAYRFTRILSGKWVVNGECGGGCGWNFDRQTLVLIDNAVPGHLSAI